MEGLTEIGQFAASKEARRYLNPYTARFAYLEQDLIKTWYGEQAYNDWWKRKLNKEDTDQAAVYQYPMGNVYEDLGIIIAKDAMENHNAHSTALAQAIWAEAKRIAMPFHYPKPLFVGILLGGYGGLERKMDLEHLSQVDFLDMNEGTQRRLRMNIDKSLKSAAEIGAMPEPLR